MKIILDECVPRRVAKQIPHEVSTVSQLKLTGLDNGKLLKTIEDQFDIFLTVDQNLQYQQNLTLSKIVIVVLTVPSNRYDDVIPLIPAFLTAITDSNPGDVISIPC